MAIHSPEVKPSGLVAYGPWSPQTRMVKHQCQRMTTSSENARRKSAYGLRSARLAVSAIAAPSSGELAIACSRCSHGAGSTIGAWRLRCRSDPRSSHRARQRRLIALGVAIALLVISNVMSNRILPEWAYVPWNLSMAFVLLVRRLPRRRRTGRRSGWASGTGTGRSASGCCCSAAPRCSSRSGWSLPATRNAFIDTRIGDADVAQMLCVVLMQIPLGTVVLEEVAFRGVLPALMGASPAIRWRWRPVLGASVLFGLWHILPSIGIDNANAAVGDALGHNSGADHHARRRLDDDRRRRHVRAGPARQGHQDDDAAALGDELARFRRRLAAAALTARRQVSRCRWVRLPGRRRSLHECASANTGTPACTSPTVRPAS